jgi:hypothetical protein
LIERGQLKRYLILAVGSFVLMGSIIEFGLEEDPDLDPRGAVAVGLLFQIAAIFGASLAIWPNWPARRFGRMEGDEPVVPASEGPPGPRRRGHHPDCEPFEDHTFTFRGKVRCAGCTGLLVGSVVAILMMAVYLVLQPEWPPELWQILAIAGLAPLVYGLVFTMLETRWRHLHVVVNSTFVLGIFVVAISTMELSGRWEFGFITVVLSFLWIESRVIVSQVVHREVCAQCPEECKAYL